METLESHLLAGGLAIASTQRLANQLRDDVVCSQAQQQNAVIKTPRVYSLDAWQQSLWQELNYSWQKGIGQRRVISVNQRHYIWESIISQSEYAQSLLRPKAAVQSADSSYRDIQRWRIDLSNKEVVAAFEREKDSRVLLAWALAFQKALAKVKLISQEDCYEIIAHAFSHKILAREKQILCVGFIDRPPLYEHVLSAAAASVEDIAIAEYSQIESFRISCKTDEEELLAAAHWSAKSIENTPARRVAVVVPDLAQRRAQVERIFRDVYQPWYLLPDQGQMVPPFNISAGIALLDVVLVADYLSFLNLLLKPAALSAVVDLLQSPFLFAVNLHETKILHLIESLYQTRQEKISFATLRRLSFALKSVKAEAPENSNNKLQQCFLDCAECLRRHHSNEAHVLSVWRQLFLELMSIAGPHDIQASKQSLDEQRSLDSIEYQQFQALQHGLEQFSAMGDLVGKVSFSRALQILTMVLKNKVFQAQNKSSQVHILGFLEAAGQRFDQVWLLGMSDQNWPPSARPNPLIPLHMQHSLKMPKVSALRENHYAERVCHMLASGCRQFVVSAPQWSGDIQCNVSGLFTTLPEKSLRDILGEENTMVALRQQHYQKVLDDDALFELEEDSAPKLSENETVSGGAGILRNQAQCPFRAFIFNRLNLQVLPEASNYIAAMDHGILVHRVMELIWRKLSKRSVLQGLSDQQQDSVIIEAIETAFQEYEQQFERAVSKRAIELQRQRVFELVDQWLCYEKTRGDFEIVALEKKASAKLDGLDIAIRLDRIDKLDDDSLLVIDYKTGKANKKSWLTPRIDDPQLPLYCLLIDGQQNAVVNGIAFASINSDAVKFISEGLGEFAGKNSDAETWQQQLKDWQADLSQLVSEFTSGSAAIDPKSITGSCTYCELHSVCRLHYQQEST